MSTYTTQFEYRGVLLDIKFDYQPAEKADREYPGCGESFEIESVFLDDIDMWELLEPQMEELEDDVWEHIKKHGI